MNHSININLLKFRSCGVMNLTGKTGTKRCLVIPIADNHLVEGEKGVYANFTAWETENLTENKTHLIKQSIPKDIFNKMTEDEKKSLPIFGDCRSFSTQAQTDETYSVPTNEKEAPF